MELYNKIVLRGLIKGLSSEGQKLRRFITSSTKESRNSHWMMKRAVGHDTRFHLLAYAYLEGRAYRTVEPHSTLEDFTKFAERLLEIVNRHTYWIKGKKNVWVNGKGYVYLHSIDDVKSWLDVPQAPRKPLPPKRPYDPSKDTRKKAEK